MSATVSARTPRVRALSPPSSVDSVQLMRFLCIACRLSEVLEPAGRAAARSACPGRLVAPSLFELFESLRPIVFEQARKRSVRKQAAAGLAGRAVVGVVTSIHDSLNGRPAHGARLAVFPVHGHLGSEGGHLVGEAVADLRPQ